MVGNERRGLMGERNHMLHSKKREREKEEGREAENVSFSRRFQSLDGIGWRVNNGSGSGWKEAEAE